MSSSAATTPPPVATVRALLGLAGPLVLARATQSVMTFADVLFVEHLGPSAITATATGGLNFFCVAILPMGTVFIVQSFVAQLVGRGQSQTTPRFAWYALVISAIAGLLALALLPLIGPVLSLTDYSPATQAAMNSYLHIRMTSLFAVVATEALGNWYGGFNNTWIAMIVSVITMVISLVLNYVLVLGNFGAPAMGVDGAALANAIASWAGFAVLLTIFLCRWGGAPKARASDLRWRELVRMTRFGLPNGINWFLEFSAFQVFVNFVFSSLGDVPAAALNVVVAINTLSFMPAFGLASAGAILVGQTIGAGARDRVWPFVRITLRCTLGWMIAVAICYLLFPAPLLSLFDSSHSGALVALGTDMLMMSAAWQVFDGTGLTLSESLRAAGDTAVPAVLRLVLAWLVFLPSALFAVRVWDGGPLTAMGCLIGYLVLLSAALGWRFASGAWKRIELIEPELV